MRLWEELVTAIILWPLTEPTAVVILGLPGLLLLALFAYWAVKKRFYLFRVVAVSAGLALCVPPLLTFIFFRVHAYLYATGLLRHTGDAERELGRALIVIATLSIAVAVPVFVFSFWLQTRRRKKAALPPVTSEEDPTLSSDGTSAPREERLAPLKRRRTSMRRVIAALVGLFVFVDALVLWYVVPTFSTSESLVQRLLYAEDRSPDGKRFIESATAVLRRRGESSIPAIAAALKTIPPQASGLGESDLTIMTDIFGPNPVHLLSVLSDIGTKEALQVLRDCAANRGHSVSIRAVAAEKFLLKGDAACFEAMDDLLHDTTKNGELARKWIFNVLESHYSPGLAAPALPYLRFSVENDILAPSREAGKAIQPAFGDDYIGLCSKLLKRDGSPEALALLARMTEYDDYTRRRVEDALAQRGDANRGTQLPAFPPAMSPPLKTARPSGAGLAPLQSDLAGQPAGPRTGGFDSMRARRLHPPEAPTAHAPNESLDAPPTEVFPPKEEAKTEDVPGMRFKGIPGPNEKGPSTSMYVPILPPAVAAKGVPGPKQD